MKRALWPEWRKLLLFAILIAIAIGGRIQAWAFVDDVMPTPPKPPLYDLLRPFPLWAIWMYLLAPLVLLSWPLRLLGLDVMRGGPWVFIAANLIYFYPLSYLAITGFDWIKGRLRPQRK